MTKATSHGATSLFLLQAPPNHRAALQERARFLRVAGLGRNYASRQSAGRVGGAGPGAGAERGHCVGQPCAIVRSPWGRGSGVSAAAARARDGREGASAQAAAGTGEGGGSTMLIGAQRPADPSRGREAGAAPRRRGA